MLLSKTTLRPARGGIGDMSSSLIQELLQGLCQFHLISRQIQGSMDGLSFIPGVEALLRSTQFSHIQPIVLPEKVLFHLRSPPTTIQIVTILNLYCQITSGQQRKWTWASSSAPELCLQRGFFELQRGWPSSGKNGRKFRRFLFS